MDTLKPVEPGAEPSEGQLSLFEARHFLGRACFIIEGVVYPQFELDSDE